MMTSCALLIIFYLSDELCLSKCLTLGNEYQRNPRGRREPRRLHHVHVLRACPAEELPVEVAQEANKRELQDRLREVDAGADPPPRAEREELVLW